ncbi:MAG: Stk1 family PASTA domain-containing Ser/Thr kinase [Clostridia bacterium]|nr:Stk1 family PASTA domain-containing Ser/Thr kinase [Clostridia bacterium]
MNLVGKTLGNRYEMLEEVGIGGMATVYKARCNLLNRFVAVKVLKDEFSKDAEFVKRFRAEAQSAASLTHPNIVSVYDVGEEDGVNYIVMEYLEGDTLKDFIDKKGKLSNEQTLKFASQIASALEAAHSAKIIHRDIKPQNIVLVNNNTIAKVTDFGIAKMSSKDTITSSASTIGSVHYFSPEHAKGCYTDEKSDIYSLGVVMYEMATGVLPFNADSPVTVALKQIQEVPKTPKDVVPSISNMLNNIIMKAMEKNTIDRYQTAAELLDDIFAAINSREDVVLTRNRGDATGNTQVVPIIGLKDDVRPSIADERPSEVISSRKLSRNGKTLSDIEQEGKEKTKKEGKKSKKKIILISIIAIVVIILGILVGSLFSTINSNRIDSEIKVEIAPKLIGEKYEDMKAKYEALGLSITVSKYEENAEVSEGYIISQSVQEGEALTSNQMEVVVSKGVKKIEMVDVVGKDYTVAKYELESLGFVPEFEFVENEEIDKNLIISQDIKKGEQVPVGSKIKIEVSNGNGKILVIVPSVIGNTEAKAKSTLEAKKLKVTVSYANDMSKADGIVLTQSYKENSEVEEGTTIELTVNRLEKTKTVTITLSTLAEGIEGETVTVKVTAQVEGVTNTIHNGSHTKQEEAFQDFTVDVNGFTSAKITVYVNDEVKEQKTISF